METQDRMMKVEEVMERLSVSKASAYTVMKELNAELEQKGLRTIPGRVSKNYFDSVYFQVQGVAGNDRD